MVSNYIKLVDPKILGSFAENETYAIKKHTCNSKALIRLKHVHGDLNSYMQFKKMNDTMSGSSFSDSVSNQQNCNNKTKQLLTMIWRPLS